MAKRYGRTAESLLEKAKESAILAVDVYNKPRTAFRSGGFVVMMTIAWTSLLHAIFEKNGVKYFYRKNGTRFYQKIDGDRKTWELQKCIQEYYEDNNPIKRNIEFFIKLRNKIEHRSMPSIDPVISGECQALVLNLEELIIKEFGESHTLIESLFVPIQFTEKRKILPKTTQEKKVLDFVKTFRNSLTSDVSESQQFAFKAFFVPKLGNHRTSSDVAIEFVKFDPANPQEMENYEKMIVGIKEKTVSVANAGKYRPNAVLKELENRGYNQSSHWHQLMWKKYEVRPPTNATNKKSCKTDYCQFDESSTTKDYVYTDAWIDFLIEKELS